MDPKLWHSAAGISGISPPSILLRMEIDESTELPSLAFFWVLWLHFSCDWSKKGFLFDLPLVRALSVVCFLGAGVAALALGTYGAHVFKPQNPSYKEVWHTASLYHLVHTAALLGAPLTKHPHIFGGLLTAGILMFSGTCYTVALFEDRKYAFVAPFGGFAFIGAWASLLF